MNTTATNTEVPQVIVNILNKHLAPCTAYCIGSRTQFGNKSSTLLNEKDETNAEHVHFDIVVFTKESLLEKARLAADDVKVISDRQLSVSILAHRLQHLQTVNACQQWFFYNVLRDGQRLCLDTKNVPYLPFNEIPQRNAEAAKTYWLKCEAVAGFHLNAANSDHLDVELIKISLLHTVAEFVCLGLIRVLMGYTPANHTLRYLMELCTHFTDLPQQLFPQNDEASVMRFKRLLAPPSMLRHWDRLEVPDEDFTILYDTCKAFLKQARTLATTKLAGLENNQK